MLNKQTLKQAWENGGQEVDSVVKMVQTVMIGAYLDQDTDAYSEEECSAVVCPRCNQLSFYSAKIMIPALQHDRLCLSPDCIKAALSLMLSQED